jgi:hypothetical protein
MKLTHGSNIGRRRKHLELPMGDGSTSGHPISSVTLPPTLEPPARRPIGGVEREGQGADAG